MRYSHHSNDTQPGAGLAGGKISPLPTACGNS